MRIALTIHAMYGGGAERLMSQLVSRWSTAGHEVHLITWAETKTDSYPFPAEVQRHGLALMRDSQSKLHGILANFRRVQVLRKTLKRIRPDFVLSFCDQMNVVTLQATRPLKIPVWIAEHSNPAKQNLGGFWEIWRAHTYPRCSGCIVLTQSIAEYMRRWIPRERLVVIPNAIDIPGESVPRMAKSPQVILALGRLSPEKGIDVLIEAWQQIQSSLPGWDLHIAGDGPQRSQLERQSQNISSIKFLGWVADPWTAYRNADIFVLPSRYEGFPVALVEAMSQSLPCIATRCTDAIDDLSENNSSLLTIAPESPSDLANAVLKLAADSQMQRRLGQAARGVSERYTWDQIGPHWDQILKSS
jgi:GalNAc-alpha-(1->4)-GalNAc-alpha-(1->3)-diNAcBac-PP-undecaprenol alpha-1,4-N-acetyl-D-galactosaminyltransferase